MTFHRATKQAPNMASRFYRFFITILDVIMLCSRALILGLSLYMFESMVSGRNFSFYLFERFAQRVRVVLTFNVFYSLQQMAYSLTLLWEKASEFNDLIEEVSRALVPFMVFLLIYLIMFFSSFYMFGQQQVGFDYYYKKN